ncbi:winged helix-turn-helix transcriptional regulator, partial [Acinetobacter baumannii]|nr:MarR family transcriptional regulator [Acinetobacter baumannii]
LKTWGDAHLDQFGKLTTLETEKSA